MQIVYIFIGIISLLILIYSIRLLITQIRLKEVSVFDISAEHKDFLIEKSGIHSISIVGLSSDFRVSGLNARIDTPTGKQINLIENKIKYSYLRKGVKTYEQWNFKSFQNGKHSLIIENLEDYISRNPILKSKKPFSNRKIETKTLKILIKQSVSIKHRLISIIGLVFGVNGSFWGILLGINPNIFG